jgi:hypothetical protein
MKDGGSVYPHAASTGQGGPEDFTPGSTGITLRQYYAGKAIHGFLAHDGTSKTETWVWDAYTRRAFEIADAMIAEEAKP